MLYYRTDGEAEDSMVATEAVEVTKESGREEPGLGWASRVVRLPFIWQSQNTASTKDTGTTDLPSHIYVCKRVDSVANVKG